MSTNSFYNVREALSHRVDRILVSIFTLVFVGLVFAFNFSLSHHEHFAYLSQSFLRGQLSFTTPINWLDTSTVNGQHYWALGPFPAILLLPLSAAGNAVGIFFTQGYLQFFLVLSVFAVAYKLARVFDYSQTAALYLAFAFTACSVFLDIALIPASWYFAQVVTVLLLFLALYEYFATQRWWLIGLYLAAVFMTRLTAAVGVIFFMLMIIGADNPRQLKLRSLLQLLLPFVPALALLLTYNELRFGHPFETGYTMQQLVAPLARARAYGMFSLRHIPGNLYYLLLSHPLPVFRDSVSHVLRQPYIVVDPWGTSLFITSPYYLYLFGGRYRTWLAKSLWVTVVSVALPILMYYGIGYIQVGYRYALDFLPFLFILLLLVLQSKDGKLPVRFKILVVTGFLFNLYLILTLRLAGFIALQHRL